MSLLNAFQHSTKRRKLQRNKINYKHSWFLQDRIDLQRALLDVTKKAGDKGTSSQRSAYITEQEKGVWIYNSYPGK